MIIFDAHTHRIKKNSVVNFDYYNQSNPNEVDYFSLSLNAED